MQIATVIGVMVREWGIPPREINARRCDEFAQEVIARMGGYSDTLTDDASNEDEPGHYWIVYRDKCYDAECPNGVSDHRNLPFFHRAA
jgi:hypothetical protein